MSRPSGLDNLRKKIYALQAERDALTSQKRSRAEVAALLENLVANWASTGAATLVRELQLAASGQPSEPLSLRGSAVVTAAPGAAQINLNMGPVLVALMGQDAVKAALIGAVAAIPEGMPSKDRMERLEAIAAELDELERDEERMVMESGAERRTDARPEIILEL